MKKIGRLVSATMIGLIKLYQKYISVLHRPSCRFYPTCSNYAIEAIRKFGPLQGGIMAAYRVLRCGPWSEGGYDPPSQPLIKLTRKR